MTKYLTSVTAFIISFLIFFPAVSLLAQKIDFSSELNRLYDMRLLPKYLDGSVVKQFSSYDRTGGNNDGFEGTYSFIRKNEDGSLVVFEAKGKGVIERLWTPTPTDDTLDFYFDGSSTPDFSIKFSDLFSGKVYPFVPPLTGQHIVGGYYSYLPIPYNNGCKIVFRGKKMLFYQFQYREYSDQHEVTSFNPASLTPSEQHELNRLVRSWNYKNKTVRHLYGTNTKVIPAVFDLRPGASHTLADIAQGGRILGIELTPGSAFEGLHKQIDLRITWDDERTPAVYVPVADFFGYAFGSKSMESLLLGVDYEGKAYCYFPMPFDKAAKVELVYRDGIGDLKPHTIHSKVYYTDEVRQPNEGRFYVNWKREEPPLGKFYTFLQGEGRGHYVGTVLQAQATDFITFTEFFEGDDSTAIDGKMTAHGTGSEDYFNGGWYAQPGGWVERLGVQLHGCLAYSLPWSRTGGYRLFVSDKMPFTKSIYHGMEHGPVANNRPVDYISTAMYYADRPVQTSMTPDNKLTSVFIPETFTFYSRLMDYLSYDGEMSLQHGSAELNGRRGVLHIKVNEIPAGRYQVYAHSVVKTPEEIFVTAGDSQSPVKFKNASANEDVFLGEVTIHETTDIIDFTLESKQKTRFIFDRVMFKKQ